MEIKNQSKLVVIRVTFTFTIAELSSFLWGESIRNRYFRFHIGNEDRRNRIKTKQNTEVNYSTAQGSFESLFNSFT